MTGPARILLVDDSVVIRGLVSRIVDAEPDLEVVATASDGKIGVQKVRALDPDLVVLDVEMPVMTGIEALREIRTTHPDVPVVMFSTLTSRGASTTFDALAAGATDYVAKPSSTDTIVRAMDQVQVELVERIRALVGAVRRPSRPQRAAATSRAVPAARPAAPAPLRRGATGNSIRAVVVGSSTGGPVALETMLTSITEPLPVPMFIVQHMPVKFTKALADRLDAKTAHRVVEADGTVEPEPGTVYIAPGGRHMRLRRHGARNELVVFDGPSVNSCLPSVEPLFASAAEVYGRNALAVMLTGMGADGTEGTRKLAADGADVLAQDEESSVVWGMPGSVVTNGLATEVLPLDRIGPRVGQLVLSRAGLAAAGARGIA